MTAAKKRYFWLFIIVMIPAVLILWEFQSPGRFSSRPEGRSQEQLCLAFSMPLLNLKATDQEFGVQSELYPFLYSFLVIPEYDGTFSPDLALRWSYDEKNRRWSFILRSDAVFHDGRPVLAEDAASSIKKLIPQNPVLSRFVTQVRALSDHELEIDLLRPAPHFLYYLSLYPISPGRINAPPQRRGIPVGSGPFRIHDIESDRRIFLTGFEGYYGKKASFKSIEVRFIPSKDRIWADFLHDRVQACWMSTPETVLLMRADPAKYRLEGRPDNRATIVLFNVQDPIFKDRRVRTALSLLINVQRHVSENLMGMALPCKSPLGLLGERLNSPPFFHYDPHKARQQLEAAGWKDHDGDGYRDKNGVPMEFDLFLSDSQQTELKTAEEIQTSCNSFGIKCHLKIKPYEKIMAENLMTGKFQACLTQANTNPQKPYLPALWWGTGGRGNFGGYKNKTLEKALHDLDEAGSMEELTRPLKDIERELAYDQPAIWLYHCYSIHAFSRRLAGMKKPYPDFYQTYPLLKARLTPGPGPG